MESPVELAEAVEESVKKSPPLPLPEGSELDALCRQMFLRLGLDLPPTLSEKKELVVEFRGGERRVLVPADATSWDARVALAPLAKAPPARLLLLHHSAELPDTAALPDAVLRLAISDRLAAGGKKNKSGSKRKKKASAPEAKPSAPEAQPSQAWRNRKRQGHQEALKEKLAGMADPGRDELLSHVGDMRKLIANARALLVAVKKLLGQAKATEDQDKTAYLGDLDLARFYFTEECRRLSIYNKLDKAAKVNLRKIQSLGRSTLKSLTLKTLLVVTDEVRLTMDQDTLHTLTCFLIEQHLLLQWHGGASDVGYSLAEMNRAIVCAERFVDENPALVAFSQLYELFPADADVPAKLPRTEEEPEEEPAEEPVEEAPVDEAEEKKRRLAKHNARAEARDAPRKAYSKLVADFVAQELEGKTVEEAEEWLRLGLRSYQMGHGIVRRADGRLAVEGPASAPLFVRGRRGSTSAGQLLPIGLINIGATCFTNSAFQVLSHALPKAAALAQPDPSAPVFQEELVMGSVVSKPGPQLLVAALRVHQEAAQDPDVLSLGLFHLHTALCAVHPTAYGSPFSVELDAVETLAHLLASILDVFATASSCPLDTRIQSRIALSCPNAACTVTRRPAEDIRCIASLSLAELGGLTDATESLHLKALLEKKARQESPQDVCCSGEGTDGQLFGSGSGTTSVVALPRTLVSKLERAKEDALGGGGLWKGRVLVGPTSDLSKATRPVCPKPRPYDAKAILLKRGETERGHYAVLLAVSGDHFVIANDAHVEEIAGALDSWPELCAGLEGFFEDVVVLEEQEWEGGELGQLGATAPADATPSSPSTSATSTHVLSAAKPPLHPAPSDPALTTDAGPDPASSAQPTTIQATKNVDIASEDEDAELAADGRADAASSATASSATSSTGNTSAPKVLIDPSFTDISEFCARSPSMARELLGDRDGVLESLERGLKLKLDRGYERPGFDVVEEPQANTITLDGAAGGSIEGNRTPTQLKSFLSVGEEKTEDAAHRHSNLTLDNSWPLMEGLEEEAVEEESGDADGDDAGPARDGQHSA